MPDPTGAERSRRYRERLARELDGRLAPAVKPTCQACSRQHTGARGVFCSRCWEKETPEGRRFKADRVARAYQKQRAARLAQSVTDALG
jgi:hypothetical protein